MKLSFILILAVLFINPYKTEHYNEPQTTSQVSFKIKNFGVNVDGSFSKASVDANIDDNNLANSFINSVIQVESIETGMVKRDEHILQQDYFNVKTYQTIRFNSLRIIKNSDRSYQVEATLTIKGITKNISIPVSMNSQNGLVTLTSEFEINRIDYGVGGRSLVLGKTVTINVRHSYIE